MPAITTFTGSVPQNYDAYLGPFLFEPYAIDIAQRISQKGFQNVLEIACGTGRVTNHLLQVLDNSAHVTATDLNKEMLQVAQEKISDERISWMVADALDLPFDNEVFDLVVCQFGVMFFPDKQKAFQNVHRVLKNGGQYIFNVWDDVKYNDATLMTQDVMQEVLQKDAPDFLKKGPFSYFDQKQIENDLSSAGFTNIKFEVVEKMGIAATSDNVIKGLLEGSPLANYLQESHAPVDIIKEKLKTSLEEKYGKQNLTIPMQAIVCSACR